MKVDVHVKNELDKSSVIVVQQKAKELMKEIDKLRNSAYGTEEYKDLLAARDYVMQCVGRLSLVK